MVEKRLIEYLKTYSSQGYTREQLKQHLTKVGWDPKTLEEAFREMSQPAKPAFTRQPVPERKAEKPAEHRESLERAVHKESYHQTNHLVPVFAIATIFILVGLFFYFYTAVLVPQIGKPNIAMPATRPIAGAAVQTDQVNYLLNEVGAYKLHNNPLPTR